MVFFYLINEYFHAKRVKSAAKIKPESVVGFAKDRPVTMQVYSTEILESVINRLSVDTMQDIKFNTMMLLPYQAKARDYKDIT